MTNSGNCYACQEVWLDVPETDGRYQISNHGHLRQMGRKERFGKTMKTVFTNVAKSPSSWYQTTRHLSSAGTFLLMAKRNFCEEMN